MSSYNKVILMGNLTRDIELRFLPSGTPIVEVGMAVNDRVKRGDEWVDETCFVEVTVFGKRAETMAQYLSKGSSILVDGRLKYSQWEKDGVKRSKLTVIADSVQFVGKGGGGQPKNEAVTVAAPEDGSVVDEDIPF